MTTDVRALAEAIIADGVCLNPNYDNGGIHIGEVEVEALARYALDREAGWQPIETAPKGQHILYFPAQRDSHGRNLLGEDVRVDYYPVHYPRKPTHWMPLPAPPHGAETEGQP